MLSTADRRSQGTVDTLPSPPCLVIVVVGNEEGMTRDRSRISNPRREVRWKTQSHIFCEVALLGLPVCGSIDDERRSAIWVLASAAGGAGLLLFPVEADLDEDRTSCDSLRPEKVDTKTDEPVGL